MRVYVAGAYSADNVIDVLNNIREGIKASAKLLKLGHEPFCPFLDYQFQFFEPELEVEDYYRYSIAWLEVSQAMIVLPDYEESKGTLNEIWTAKELEIPTFYSMQDFLEWCGHND